VTSLKPKVTSLKPICACDVISQTSAIGAPNFFAHGSPNC